MGAVILVCGVLLVDVCEAIAAQIALLAGIAMTVIYIVGLLVRDKPRVLGMGIDSVVVIGIYLGSLYAFYIVH